MHKLIGRYPRLTFYLFLAMALAVTSGAGKKWAG